MSVTMRWKLSIGAVVMMALGVSATWTLAQAPSGSLLVVLRNEKAGPVLGVIDPAAGKMVARVPIGIDPHAVTVSDDGRLAFVANTNGHGQTKPEGDSISVVDIAARKEVRRVEVGQGSMPHDIRFVGGKVFFSASGFKAIGRYDPARNKVEYFGLGQEGTHMLASTRDATKIFVANNQSNNVAVIEGANPPEWKLTLIPVGLVPEGTDMSPDETQVWTVNEEGGTVSIIDVATKKVAQTLDLKTDHANRLRFTPNGKYVIVLDRQIAEVVVIDAASRQVAKRLKMTGEKPSMGDLVVLPDSSRAYITVQSAAPYIADLDLETLTVTRRIDLPSRGDGLAWSATRASSATN